MNKTSRITQEIRWHLGVFRVNIRSDRLMVSPTTRVTPSDLQEHQQVQQQHQGSSIRAAASSCCWIWGEQIGKIKICSNMEALNRNHDEFKTSRGFSSFESAVMQHLKLSGFHASGLNCWSFYSRNQMFTYFMKTPLSPSDETSWHCFPWTGQSFRPVSPEGTGRTGSGFWAALLRNLLAPPPGFLWDWIRLCFGPEVTLEPLLMGQPAALLMR